MYHQKANNTNLVEFNKNMKDSEIETDTHRTARDRKQFFCALHKDY